MGVRVETDDDKCCVLCDGELTIYTVPEYRKTIQDCCATDRDIEVNLSEISEIDTSGLQLLAALGRQASDAGNKLLCVNPSEQVVEVLELSRFFEVLNCENDEGLQS